MKTAENIDLTIPRRRYIYDDINLTNCSECGSPLIDQNCTILLQVKSETDEAEFITNLTGSHFCDHCPVVVFDSDKIKQAAILGIRGSENLRHFIKGIIDLDSIPENKRHLEMGIDENPIPLVRFLPDLNKHPKIAQKKPQRNDPCSCGSGKKYKNCCLE